MQNSFYSPEPEAFPPHSIPPDSQPIDILTILWSRFYKWEHDESLSMLEGLQVFDWQPPQSDDIEEYEGERWDYRDRQYPFEKDPEEFEIVDYENPGSLPFTTIAIVEGAPVSRNAVRSWKPNPRYTTCTPLWSSIDSFIDWNHKSDVFNALFALFSDDPTFDLDRALRLYDQFAWQVDFKDPDHEMIKLETVRLLHFQQSLSLQEIDDLKLPSFAQILVPGGLVWEACQRDFLYWPESQMSRWPQLTLDYAQAHWVDPPKDMFGQVYLASRLFCPNLDCLITHQKPCGIHRVPPVREQPKPTIATSEYPEGDACGESCFRHIQDDIDDDDAPAYLYWTNKKDLDMLEDILKFAPDALPCDLAVICRKPCDQIFANRRKLYPDEEILDNRVTEPPSRFDIRRPVHFADKNTENYTYKPIVPCSHAGTCRRGECSCYNQNYHCDRNCRCSIDCKIRWQGCECHELKKRCSSKSCSCVAAMRECDPELCLGCDAREAGTVSKSRRCWNNDIQQGRGQRIRVSPSEWGYGAFATETIRAKAYLGDYIGEITNSAPHESVGEIEAITRKFIGLNYAFELLTNTTMVDSKSAGNETRYLNHGSGLQANCEAVVKTVHGTHHIILTTTSRVEAGKELLLDYGPRYWDEHGSEDDDEEKQDSSQSSD